MENNSKNKKETIISMMVLIFLIAISVWYAYKIGLLFCGYYFADDHEIARLHGGIVRDGLFKTMQLWIVADTNLRFRPVYWIFRVMEAYICGTHIVLWHLIKACEIGFCAWVGYVFARKMHVPHVAAFLFGVVGFFGSQCAVVYRLGPQEPLALIWMFMGLICLVKDVEQRERFRGWRIGFHICMTIMMLTKESFLILIPIFLFFIFILELQQMHNSDRTCREIIKLYLKKYVVDIIYELIVFAVCMGVIILHSGVSSTGYAGLDASYTLRDYFNGMWKVWTGDLLPYSILLIIFMGVNICLSIVYHKDKKFLLSRLCEIVFVLYFVLSQSLLHAKTGMSERYLFPCITGIFIYVFCMSIPLWADLVGKRCITTWTIEGLLAVWAMGMIFSSQFHALCLNYVFTCSNNTQMLIRLSELAEQNGGKDCRMIVSTPYGEWNLAISAFMEELYDVDYVYSLSQTSSTDQAVDRYMVKGETQETISLSDADIFIAQQEFLPEKMRACGIEYTQLQQEIFGNYMIFIK